MRQSLITLRSGQQNSSCAVARSCVTLVCRYLSVRSYLRSSGQVLGTPQAWAFIPLFKYSIEKLSAVEYLPQSGHVLLTQVGSICSWTLPCVSSLVPTVLHLSHGFQCSPTLNRQPYEGRLPLTSWWRKSSNMTVRQTSLISLAHHCYDWHPGSRYG